MKCTGREHKYRWKPTNSLSNSLILKELLFYLQDNRVIWITTWPWPIQQFGKHFCYAYFYEAIISDLRLH